MELNHVLEQVIIHATKLTNSVIASIILKCDSSDDLVIRSATGQASESILNIRFPAAKGIAGLCTSTGQIIVVHDAKKPPHHFAEIDKVSGFKTKSVLCVPLCVRGKTIGCVELLNKCDDTTFSNDDIAVATIMSNLAAVSVANAKSYNNLQRMHSALKSQLSSAEMVIGKNEELPSLRERKEDIPAFAEFFLEKYRNELNTSIRKFDRESMNALLRYDYPGSMRKLENIVERAVVLAENDVIHVSDLPDEIHKRRLYDRYINKPEMTMSICDMEKDVISRTLIECSWNQSMAARLLGLSRDKLRYRIKKYRITKPGNSEQVRILHSSLHH